MLEFKDERLFACNIYITLERMERGEKMRGRGVISLRVFQERNCEEKELVV